MHNEYVASLYSQWAVAILMVIVKFKSVVLSTEWIVVACDYSVIAAIIISNDDCMFWVLVVRSSVDFSINDAPPSMCGRIHAYYTLTTVAQTHGDFALRSHIKPGVASLVHWKGCRLTSCFNLILLLSDVLSGRTQRTAPRSIYPAMRPFTVNSKWKQYSTIRSNSKAWDETYIRRLSCTL